MSAGKDNMGKIELNLKARGLALKMLNHVRVTKAEIAETRKHTGIKTARKLVNMFKHSNLCPTVTRLSFSRVLITY